MPVAVTFQHEQERKYVVALTLEPYGTNRNAHDWSHSEKFAFHKRILTTLWDFPHSRSIVTPTILSVGTLFR